jgi:D-inositol-3-phosphate glycosyltransferase
VIVVGGAPGAGSDRVNAELARLQRMRDELGIRDLVTFLGARDQDTLVYYYSAAEMVVIPSHYESFGMVALEAMACGTPVIASRVGGLIYNVQDGRTGFLVPDGDAEALAERIRLLYFDDGLRERLSRQATLWAKGFGWPAITDQIVELYGQVRSEREPAVRAG